MHFGVFVPATNAAVSYATADIADCRCGYEYFRETQVTMSQSKKERFGNLTLFDII